MFGEIYVANGSKIGANAVVNKSCHEENAILVGVPAKNCATGRMEMDE